MLIVFFLAALASGGLAGWLLWPQGPFVALLAAAFLASSVVAALAVVLVARRSRAPEADTPRPRGVLDLLGLRQPR